MTDLNKPAEPILKPHQWVDRYADYLYSFALARINDRDLAKDLVQETFLAALEKLGSFQAKSSERSWLTAILKYKIIDIYRKGRAEEADPINPIGAKGQPSDFFDSTNGHWNPGHFPERLGIEDKDPLLNEELAEILQRCLNKLPRLWLSVFTLKHVEEMATDSICDELNITPANFWVVIHRAKVNLRACIQKNWQ